MAIYSYKKYKILLHADSKKTQGLQTGDIVRRQYFDGKNVIYSLMCVLEYGRERSKTLLQDYTKRSRILLEHCLKEMHRNRMRYWTLPESQTCSTLTGLAHCI